MAQISRSRRTAAVWIGLDVATALWGVAPSSVAAQPRVYVQVVDQRTGSVVNDLRASEVIVREGGVPRPVLDVRLANLPVSLALLVDNGPTSARAFSRVQAGLRDFIDRLPANQSMSLLALAPEPRWIARDVRNAETMRQAIDGLVSTDEAPPRVLEGVEEAARWLAAASGHARPVAVLVSADKAYLLPDATERFGVLSQRLRRDGITVHTLVMLSPAPGSLERRVSVPEAIGRDLSTLTHGAYVSLFLGASLDQQLTDIADRIRARGRELARQHLVRFDRPEGEAPGPVRITVTRLGARSIVTPDGR
jgi:hypothetical protein